MQDHINKSVLTSHYSAWIRFKLNAPASLHCLLIILLGCTLYANTLKVPFLFDDLTCIVNNSAISSYFDSSIPVSGIHTGLSRDIVNSMDARRVTYFTFALNHLLHGYDVTGYHLLNIAIHLAAALALYALLATILKTPFFTDYSADKGIFRAIPLIAALLFVSHPIQTSAVTYVVQRFTILAALFYLLSITLYLRARMAPDKRWQIVLLVCSVAVAAVGMFTKETVFTLPVMAAVCEIMFLRGARKVRLLFLLPLFCTMLIIPLNMHSQVDATGSVREALDDSINLGNLTNVSQQEYFLTQQRVIVTYLRLLIMPVGQHLDYDFPRHHSIFELPVALSALFLFGIFLSAVWAYARSRTDSSAAWPLRFFSFGVVWFFVTISMSSSIIPLDDMIFEYRLYLPSIGFFIAIMALGAVVWQKLELSGRWPVNMAIGGMFLVITGLSVATVSRNHVWGDPIRFWEDNVAKAPQKARPHHNLAMAYANESLYAEAIKENLEALQLSRHPNFISWYNLAICFTKLKRMDDALAAFDNALKLAPRDIQTRVLYAETLATAGRDADSAEQLRIAEWLRKSSKR